MRVFDGVGTTLSAPTNVLVRGNRIVAIGTSAADGTARVIDGRGRTLMPGLIDVHVHLTFGAMTMQQLASPDLTPARAEAAAAQGAEAMLLRGFTSVRDMGGPIWTLKAGIDAGKYRGPRIWPSGAMISQTAGHGDLRLPSEPSRRFTGQVSRAEKMGATFIADGRDEVLTATRENLRFGASQIKLMAGGGTSSDYDPLDVSQYTLDELRAAVEAADDWNTYVAVHAYTPRSVRRAIEAGVKCIEHGQLLDQATLQLMAERGTWLSLQMLQGDSDNMDAARRAKRRPVIEAQQTDLGRGQTRRRQAGLGHRCPVRPRGQCRTECLPRQPQALVHAGRDSETGNARQRAAAGAVGPAFALRRHAGRGERGRVGRPDPGQWRSIGEHRPDHRSGEELRRDHEGWRGRQGRAMTRGTRTGSGWLSRGTNDRDAII